MRLLKSCRVSDIYITGDGANSMKSIEVSEC